MSQKDNSAFRKLTSTGNWYEFLDAPRNVSVLRVCGNLVALLALPATHLTKTQDLVVTFKSICRACVKFCVELRSH